MRCQGALVLAGLALAPFTATAVLSPRRPAHAGGLSRVARAPSGSGISMQTEQWRAGVTRFTSAALAVAVGMGGLALGGAEVAMAAGNEATSATGITYKLPPVDSAKKDRCMFTTSAIGQANAARDSLLDLRFCDMNGKSAEGFDLSGLIASEAQFENVNFKDAQLSKSFLRDSSFVGADFTNGIVDRSDFQGSNLQGAIFENTVLTSTSFQGADLTNTDFSESYLGDFDLRKLCKNPTLKGENPKTGNPTRTSAGCL
uniref:Uncharacterized protein n=1 Tax=Rhizochromulina marina TaxID=1034831 RepID=A0A7S2WDI2_9STRA|mmetsp:Transcript_20797/g.60780  ORF Transcript_20797/g.60780 Transcript_20797/m.60780 type:complete len:258 (+) Transcript_20797:35-808(+)